MPSFTFANAILWAELESLLGSFWPPGHMFGTPVEGPGSHFPSAVYVVPVQPEFSHPSCTIVQPKSDKKVMTPVHQRPPSGPLQSAPHSSDCLPVLCLVRKSYKEAAAMSRHFIVFCAEGLKWIH